MYQLTHLDFEHKDIYQWENLTFDSTFNFNIRKVLNNFIENCDMFKITNILLHYPTKHLFVLTKLKRKTKRDLIVHYSFHQCGIFTTLIENLNELIEYDNRLSNFKLLWSEENNTKDDFRDLSKFKLVQIDNIYLPLKHRFKLENLIKRADFLEYTKNLKIEKIFLYGSCCRGHAREDSDIDLLVITNNQKYKNAVGNNLTDLTGLGESDKIFELDIRDRYRFEYANYDSHLKERELYNTLYNEMKLIWESKKINRKDIVNEKEHAKDL